MPKDDLSKSGYSREEEYFYKRNRELIEHKRGELDRLRHERAQAESGGDHWMRCPKCGGRMEEIDLAQIKVEQCTDCQGLYLDHGELETLLQSQDPGSFLGSLRRLLG